MLAVTSIREFYPYSEMDERGMLPVAWKCLGCGRQLNGDGGHPAELYAGTFNGLCYPCTSAGPYVVGVAVLDGLRKLSYPPSCPSWRRDREREYAYPDCPKCLGSGRYVWARSGRGRQSAHCEDCFARWTHHPARLAADRWYKRVHQACEAVFSEAVDQAAGVPGRCTKKRRAELREAFISATGEGRSAEFEALHALYRPGAERIRKLVTATLTERGCNVWREPEGDERQVQTRQSPACACGDTMSQHLDGTGRCLAYAHRVLCKCESFKETA